MADLTLKVGDTSPLLTVTCAFSDGTVKDLSGGGSATLAMWNAVSRGTPKVNDSAMTLVDAPNGVVAYQWVTNDTDTAGVYHFEVHTTDSTGKKDSFPDGAYGTVTILPRITT